MPEGHFIERAPMRGVRLPFASGSRSSVALAACPCTLGRAIGAGGGA
ncbi:hypothetical protein Pla163_17350 [Planctomycetes bacterium Pla163]|uniref:Uncharacterized protein n=1 Tax=Rohdeia mirabilis TaxID=2528008 RepID=A0A518CZG4_9BACT|nr:hypothetical protein Pla163_17350 [Planctomycetes bacterium Pla163]